MSNLAKQTQETKMKKDMQLFTWDWKEQPPINAICEAIADRVKDDGVPGVWFYVETNSDQYAGIVAPNDTTQQEAQSAYEANYNGQESRIIEDADN